MQTQKLTLMRCEDQCTKKATVTFNGTNLQSQIDTLKSPNAKDLLAGTFADLFNAESDDDDSEETSLLEADPEMDGDMPEGMLDELEGGPKKKAKFNNPPVPKTKVPGNPCTDPNMGAPSAEDKRAAKCTLKKSPQCYKLQQRFLQIQAEIEDTRDDLMDQISKLEIDCKTIKNSLEASIKADNDLLSSSQTKLAAATEKEASAGETGRQVAAENQGYNDDLIKKMKICSTNYIDFETELCALKKIRGDLHKKMKPGHSGFFQDCELGKWTPEACTKVCTDPGTTPGTQKVIRSVLQHPSGGSKCLPLSAEKDCNLSPCPINCKLGTWSGWSKCSAKCGGGASTRVRDVKVPMRYDGRPCGGTTQTRQCNVEACEKDCTLRPWTAWTACSKDCDGGTEKRERFIQDPVEGAGSCADQWDVSRLQYKPCNAHRCKAARGEAMKCNSTLDVIIMMDGTPKSGKKGWAHEVKGANKFVDAFQGAGITAKPNIAVVHYTGPRTWSGVSKCTGKSKKKVDMEGTCKIKIAQQFTEDLKKVKGIINGLEYSPGSKLLSLGLMTVQSMFALGRATARTVVVVFIDGNPLSFRKTKLTSHEIRKKARLVYVPVTKFSPLKDLKEWSSRRWQENIVSVKESKRWGWSSTSTHIVANICPKKFPKLKAKKA